MQSVTILEHMQKVEFLIVSSLIQSFSNLRKGEGKPNVYTIEFIVGNTFQPSLSYLDFNKAITFSYILKNDTIVAKTNNRDLLRPS